MLRFHEIAEANHRILNPFTEAKLMEVGEICRLRPHMTHLDLCCGKGEALSRWAQVYGTIGVGVDISPVFLEAARQRAEELGVARQVSFVEGDAAQFVRYDSRYDVVSCIGATWIGNGLAGTLELMKSALKPDGLLLVGEPYWMSDPTPEALAAVGGDRTAFASLFGTLARIESAGCELVEMVLADQDSWDRYIASQWFTAHQWLQANPHDPDAAEFRQWIKSNQRAYLEYQRDYLGWGVFIVRIATTER
jgi:SAM-dependent methyltransferase